MKGFFEALAHGLTTYATRVRAEDTRQLVDLNREGAGRTLMAESLRLRLAWADLVAALADTLPTRRI